MSSFAGFDAGDEPTVDLFGGINAADIADDPYDVPDDSYRATCSEAKIAQTKPKADSGKTPKWGLTITWTITDASSETIIGRKVNEWFQVGPYENPAGSEEYKKEVDRRSWLKRRLTSMGVPENKMNSASITEDIVGTEGTIKTKKVDGNVRIQEFKMVNASSGSSGGVNF